MLVALLAYVFGAQQADAPKIVSFEPAHLAAEVDAKKTTRLIATFDRAMSTDAFSFCGGGPLFPKFKGKPLWASPKRVVVEVELEPDHEYRLSLNCPAANNFRSDKGEALAPTPWTFSTLPEKLPDAGKQKTENRKAFEVVQKLIAGSYSYADLRVHDWGELYKQHEATIVGAKTVRGWVSEVARMLAATHDLHLYLRLGDSTLGTGSRAVDSLFRDNLLKKYVNAKAAGDNALVGQTDDSIGYVMIANWSNAADVDAVENALESLRECKAMVIDVRPNSGGDETLARRVAAWFVDGTKVYAKNRYRIGPGKDGFGPILERRISGNQAAARRFRGAIAVLTSRYVMSSNESFVLMLRQARDCTVVGQPTFGSSGNPKPYKLPNGVTLVLPSWQDLRLDGTCFEGEGLAPDVVVDADAKVLQERDPILERALEMLRQKVK